MKNVHQLTRSHLTLGLLMLMLLVGFSGVVFADQEKVDLNTATAEQLEQLPGIGPALAEQIVAYRTVNGPFKSAEQLMEVKGIGEKKFAKIKDLVMIGTNE